MKPTPEHYQSLLGRVEARDDSHIIQTMLLRSCLRPSTSPRTPVILASTTRPTRISHRLFAGTLIYWCTVLFARRFAAAQRCSHQARKGAAPLKREKIYPYDMGAMVALGEQCSMTERRADDATREVDAWLKCEFLKDRIGEEFEGVIAAVTTFGVFVELSDLYIEGLIHVSALPGDYYHFDQAKQRLIGERTRQVFQLGGAVTVRVARVDLDDRKIDLELSGVAPSEPKPQNRQVTEILEGRQDR
ncbi:MAG: hypothetical protein CM15mP89_2830 [Gammaproteobacteria bacterium]|nr:MAG: hypothetical protein CM15mP89_2830 [Gammaproteobacteria bacterium]